jgi:hypothetical protein
MAATEESTAAQRAAWAVLTTSSVGTARKLRCSHPLHWARAWGWERMRQVSISRKKRVVVFSVTATSGRMHNDNVCEIKMLVGTFIYFIILTVLYN